MNIYLTNILFLLIILTVSGCNKFADRYYLSAPNRTVTNDKMFNSAKVVVIDAEFDEIPFTERQVTLSNSRFISKGNLKVDKKIVLSALSESLSFDNKIVFTLSEYNKIKKDLSVIRPKSGYKEPRIDSLIRLKISYGIQTGVYESEGKYKFFNKSRRCQYIKNPPKDYKPCVRTADKTWDEIRLIKGSSGNVNLLYSGEIYLNLNGSFIHHKSFSGAVRTGGPYEDEHVINQKVASGLGSMIRFELGVTNLSITREIDESNHNEAIDLLKDGKIELARKMLEEDVESNIFNSSADFYNLGIIYHLYGETKIAADYYEKAISAGGYKRMYIDALKDIKVLDEASNLD